MCVINVDIEYTNVMCAENQRKKEYKLCIYLINKLAI